MKKIVLLFSLSVGVISFISCKKEVVKEPSTSPDTISFQGDWERDFEPIPTKLQHAEYKIYQDSIRYILTGDLATANYLLVKKGFMSADNRFVGQKPNAGFYVMFVKEFLPDSIKVYKQLVLSVQDGLDLAIPSDTTTQNYGWNTFSRK